VKLVATFHLVEIGEKIMATKDNSSKIKYFIVERSSLANYGSENGSDKAEAERLLAESASEVGELCVIRGELIKPTFVLD
jgi:hypothetical protein